MNKILFYKDKVLNFWWLIISFYGLIHFTVHRINYFMYPIGFSLFLLGILTFIAKENIKKISYGFLICLILITGMSYAFQSTSTFFAFLVSSTILILYSGKYYSAKEAYFSLLIIPSLCDIFAGLNKLMPRNQFLYADGLKNILEQNLFNEPEFMINNIDLIKYSIPFIEIISGVLILANPKKTFPLIIAIHLPIALSTGGYLGHLIQLTSYSLFLFFCIFSAINVREKYFNNCSFKSTRSIVKSNIRLFLKNPKLFISDNLSPLLILVMYQITLPLLLLLVRLITGIKFFNGYGWQMYS